MARKTPDSVPEEETPDSVERPRSLAATSLINTTPTSQQISREFTFRV